MNADVWQKCHAADDPRADRLPVPGAHAKSTDKLSTASIKPVCVGQHSVVRSNRHITALEAADAKVRAGAAVAQDSHQDATALLSSVGQALDDLRDGLPDPANVQRGAAPDAGHLRRARAHTAGPPRARVPLGRWAAIAAAAGGFVLLVTAFVWTPDMAVADAGEPGAAPVSATVEPAAAPAIPQATPSPTLEATPIPEAAQASVPVSLETGSQMYTDRFGKSDSADVRCLAEAIYYEARGEPVIGQIAVAQVVLNRVRSGRWGPSICRVVNQGISRGEKCQFSFACRTFRTKPIGDAWTQARDIANDAVQGRAWLRELVEATHYHTLNVSPVWRIDLEPLGTYGQHVFYKARDLQGHLSLAHAVERHEVEASASVGGAVPRPPHAAAALPAAAAIKSRPARVTAAKVAAPQPTGEPDWMRSLNTGH